MFDITDGKRRVVDTMLRAYGVKNVRVVDAGVVYTIAERVTNLILGDTRELARG